jgi:hypothetical protein
MNETEYKQLCAEIHRKYGRKLGLPYWESCDLAHEVYTGETTKEKLLEYMAETVEENQ